jgi:hypothetical protein
LDNETDLLNKDASLDERVAVALEELPFLKNCRFIAQLSSSAGLGIIKKGNEEKHELLVLVARYTLGYQIEYCLRTTDICNVNCEQ